MRAWIVLMGLLLVTAGCIGTNGDDAPEASTNASEDPAGDGPTSGSGTDGTDASGGTHTHEAQPEPHWDNRTGEVDGTNAVVVAAGVTNETIEIPENTTEMRVRLQAESGELDGRLYPPGCEASSDPTAPPSDCSHDMRTYNSTEETLMPDGGVATWAGDDAERGNWTLAMHKADPGQTPVPYELTFFYVDVHKPAPDHHEA